MYAFDTGPFSALKHYFPTIFPSLWAHLDQLAGAGTIVSTREVKRELDNGDPNATVSAWVDRYPQVFTMPTPEELTVVQAILAVPHFQAVIGEKQRLRGSPVADPFIVAAAAIRGFGVVTTEVYKPNAPKVPNICEHFGVRCLTLEQFMEEQKLTY